MKNKAENFSISSYNKFIGSHTKKNNYTSIKIRKYNSPNIIKKSNYLFLDYKNNIKSKKNYSIDISKENKNNNEQKENKGYKGNYELKKNLFFRILLSEIISCNNFFALIKICF